MKNMYLAAAMVVSLAFSACSDEESGKAPVRMEEKRYGA